VTIVGDASARDPRIPPRLQAAAELLDPGSDERVLEIGCGRGALASLLVDRVGHYVGIDRSATATGAAARRIPAAIASGRAEVLTVALADLDPGARGPVDRVLAINVNVFWTGPATWELAILSALLSPGGTLDLVYGSDGGIEPRPDIADRLVAHLVDGGFPASAATVTRDGVTSLHVRATKR
jgi:SAM-dependent methyltransferase